VPRPQPLVPFWHEYCAGSNARGGGVSAGNWRPPAAAASPGAPGQCNTAAQPRWGCRQAAGPCCRTGCGAGPRCRPPRPWRSAMHPGRKAAARCTRWALRAAPQRRAFLASPLFLAAALPAEPGRPIIRGGRTVGAVHRVIVAIDPRTGGQAARGVLRATGAVRRAACVSGLIQPPFQACAAQAPKGLGSGAAGGGAHPARTRSCCSGPRRLRACVRGGGCQVR
jgi:hypothetical protein